MNRTELTDNPNNTHGATIVLDNRQGGAKTVYSDMSLAEARDAAFGKDVPEKIRQMLRLYEYGDGSFKKKCWNFYKQGARTSARASTARLPPLWHTFTYMSC